MGGEKEREFAAVEGKPLSEDAAINEEFSREERWAVREREWHGFGGGGVGETQGEAAGVTALYPVSLVNKDSESTVLTSEGKSPFLFLFK